MAAALVWSAYGLIVLEWLGYDWSPIGLALLATAGVVLWRLSRSTPQDAPWGHAPDAYWHEHEWLRAFVEEFPDAVSSHRLDGTCLYVTPVVRSVLGWSPEQLVGRSLAALVHPDDRARYEEERKRLLRQKHLHLLGVRFRCSDGSYVRLESTFRVIRSRDPSRAPTVLVSTRNATDLYDAKARVTRAESRYRRLVESELLGLIETDGAGAILEANDAFLRLSGYTRADLAAGELRWDTATPSELQHLNDIAIASVRDSGIATPWHTEFIRADGTRAPVAVGLARIEGTDGRCVGFLLDLSKERELEGQLRRAQWMENLGRLTGGIAHDFRNVLSVITGYADLIVDASPDPNAADHGRRILDAAESGASLVGQLTAFRARSASAPRLVDPKRIVRRSVRMLAPVLRRGVRLRILLADDAGTVLIDPVQLEQVVMNLLINASDAVGNEGNITIRVARVRDAREAVDELVLEVEDTGCGMDAPTRARMFEPLFTTKAEFGGTGLGMAIVEGIVRQAGGRMEVESQEGCGTVVRVALARAGSSDSVLSDSHAAAVVRVGFGRALVVSPDARERTEAVSLLEAAGFQAVVAATILEAHAAAGEQDSPFDLLLAAWRLPDGTARRLARELGDSVMHAEVAVIGPVHSRDLESIDAHAVNRPLTAVNLSRIVTRVVERRRSRREGRET